MSLEELGELLPLVNQAVMLLESEEGLLVRMSLWLWFPGLPVRPVERAEAEVMPESMVGAAAGLVRQEAPPGQNNPMEVSGTIR